MKIHLCLTISKCLRSVALIWRWVRSILNNKSVKPKDTFALYKALKTRASRIILETELEVEILRLFLTYECDYVSEHDYETNLNVFKGFFQRVNDFMATQSTNKVKVLDTVYQYAALIPILF